MPPDYVARRAVTLLAIGPDRRRDGRDASRRERAGIGDFVAVDMGGTSFDICLVRDGRPEIKTDWNWRYRYYIGLPMVDVQSVGAGGGSIARVRQGALLVGPESAGSAPGPVCYGRGGTRPTRDRRRRGARLPARRRLRRRAHAPRRRRGARPRSATHVAEPLGIDVTEAAWGIERIVNANMANATRKVLAGHGADPRDLALIAYGGNGAVHACGDRARARRRPHPRAEGRARVLARSACSSPTTSSTSCARTSLPCRRSTSAACATLMTELLRGGRQGARAHRPRPRPTSSATLFAQMCYPGQNFDMSVPVPEGAALDEPGLLDLAERFHDQHEAERGFCFRSQQPLMRGVRVDRTRHHAEARPPRRDRRASPTRARRRSGTRRAYWGDGFVDTPVYDGTRLGDGRDVDGPALIEEPFTVVVLPPDATATLDGLGNYVISV